MFRFYLFSQRPYSNHTEFDPSPDLAAIDEAGELGHVGLVMPLVDTASLTLDRKTAFHVGRALKSLTGEDYGGDTRSVGEWYRWLGAHPEIEPPPDYDRWKGTLYAQFDLSLENFIYRDVPSRVHLWAIQWGGLGPFDMPALDEPKYVDAAGKRAAYLDGDEPVVGVSINGQARAYPLRILDHHEIVNDTVGGVPISLSTSPINGTVTLYETNADGRPHTFGTSGYLYQGDKLLYDRATRSLWHSITGEPVVGRLALSGINLNRLPSTVTAWSAWKEKHPDTSVLSIETGFVRSYGNPLDRKTFYGAYRASPNLMFPVFKIDERLPDKAPVFGLQHGADARAWQAYDLWTARILNDALGGRPVVITVDAASGAVRAYERGPHSFQSGSTSSSLVDEGGGAWTAGESHLVSAADPGKKLERLSGVHAYWSAWYAFHPETTLYVPD